MRGVGGVAGGGAGQRVVRVRVRVRVSALVAHRDELLRVRSAHITSTLTSIRSVSMRFEACLNSKV